MVSEIGTALHVVDAWAEGAVALDSERQALDESEGMNLIEVAQHQDSRRILAPRRTRQDVIAAAGMSCDALDGGREIAIALCDHGRELVDLPGCFRRRFDLDPAADSVEDGFGIEGVGGFLHVVACHCHSGSALARAPE